MTFREALAKQRWDDHRYYHHSRVNQSLHLLSAITFTVAYAAVFVEPAFAVLLGWLIAMPSRQIGHFFFEPKTYDVANQASHEYKEAIKVGYNLRRKAVLMTIWAAAPLIFLWDPSFFGLVLPASGWQDLAHNVSVVWLGVGIGAIVGRSLQLCIVQDPQTGIVWATKILTDPFHDIALYYRSPLHLLRGEWVDPITRDQTA
jgi:hypothetical protein